METEDLVEQVGVTRLEIVDWTYDAEIGRLLTRYDVKVSLSYQDNGRTLKVFMEDLNSKEESVGREYGCIYCKEGFTPTDTIVGHEYGSWHPRCKLAPQKKDKE